ncbi:hypothetical protein [Phaffia rhodozyma]|uniref:Uncharacterized protein n=1 Tax=Phaffia rhodozyma TaxID=264483 RepID=A0A0F7SUD1_PHARH|nr:hypothetical protein [Phaffia rhodozyma]
MGSTYDQATGHLASLQAHLASLPPNAVPSSDDLTTYLALFKLIHRLASTHIVQAKSETAELRNALDKLVLEENGSEYEKKRLGQEIEKCQDFQQDSFQKLGIQQAIEKLTAGQDTNIHQVTLKFLEQEKESMMLLSAQKTSLDKDILSQQRELDQLKLELSGVDRKMEDLLKITQSIQNGVTHTLNKANT